jgi:hypothetical protein
MYEEKKSICLMALEDAKFNLKMLASGECFLVSYRGRIQDKRVYVREQTRTNAFLQIIH